MIYTKTTYIDNGTLAVLANDGDGGFYGLVTVNLPGLSETLPPDSQFVDENNWSGIVDKIEKEGIAEKLKNEDGTVVTGHFGFCTYTAMKFNLDKIPNEVTND